MQTHRDRDNFWMESLKAKANRMMKNKESTITRVMPCIISQEK